MDKHGIPEKLFRIVKCMYTNKKCTVIITSRASEWFKIKSGVKQGFPFLIVIDWVMRNSTADNNTGTSAPNYMT
jgi:hypothetical protein